MRAAAFAAEITPVSVRGRGDRTWCEMSEPQLACVDGCFGFATAAGCCIFPTQVVVFIGLPKFFWSKFYIKVCFLALLFWGQNALKTVIPRNRDMIEAHLVG